MFKQILAGLAALFLAAAAHAAVDVNTATTAELEAVKGIGPGLATVIMDERKKRGFTDWGDFVGRVKGVGDRNAMKFSAAGLTVDGKAYAGVSEAAKAVGPAKAKRTEKKTDAKGAPAGRPKS